MATQADFGWEIPDLSDIADGPDAFLQFADDVAATVKDGTWTSYTPAWTAGPQAYPGVPSTQPSGLASRAGWYIVKNKICDYTIELQFGGSTYGAYGSLYLGLPIPASTQHTLQLSSKCSLFTPSTGTVWSGTGYIDGGGNIVRPHFAIASNRSDMLPWASAGSIYTNKANPDCNLDGRTNVQPGGAIYIQGRYHTS